MISKNKNNKSKSKKVVRAYTIDSENIEKLKKIRETEGTPSSWIVNKAIAYFIQEKYGLE